MRAAALSSIAVGLLLVLSGCSVAKGVAHEQAAAKEVEKQSTPELPQTLDELNELHDAKVAEAKAKRDAQETRCYAVYGPDGASPSSSDLHQSLKDSASDYLNALDEITRWYKEEKLLMEARK